MSQKTIPVDELSSTILDALHEYSSEVMEATKASVKEQAAATVQELKTTSPKRTGKYARNWKSKIAFEGMDDIRALVYNGGKTYRLTHLLEYGHDIKRDGRVVGHAPAKAHIRPAEQKAIDGLGKKIKVKLR